MAPGAQANGLAAIYVRALQNPTCRWSTYDAIRLGQALDPRARQHPGTGLVLADLDRPARVIRKPRSVPTTHVFRRRREDV